MRRTRCVWASLLSLFMWGTVCSWGQTADLNCDGCVDLVDLGLFAKEWGLPDTGPVEDHVKRPIIVRSLLNDADYYAYVASDREGVYWTRYHFGIQNVLRRPGDLPTSGAAIYVLQDVFFGRCYEGRMLDVSRAKACSGGYSYPVTGTWMAYRMDSAGNYIEWDIPDHHNRIHLFFWGLDASGTATLSLGTAAEATAYNGELSCGMSFHPAEYCEAPSEVVLATDSTSSSRVLRITAESPSVFIFGCKTFNTSNDSADPAARLVGDGLWQGNDLLTKIGSSNTGYINVISEEVAACSWKVLYGETAEFTLSWAPRGKQVMWSTFGPNHSVQGHLNPAPPHVHEKLQSDASVTYTATTVNDGGWDTSGVSAGDLVIVSSGPTVGEVVSVSGTEITVNGWYPSTPSDNRVAGVFAPEGFSTLRIGGGLGSVSSKNMRLRSSIPLGTVFQDDYLSITDTLFADYAFNEDQDDADNLVDIHGVRSFTASGYAYDFKVTFGGECDVNVLYITSLPLANSVSEGKSGYVTFPPYASHHEFAGSWGSEYTQLSVSDCRVVLDGNPFVIVAGTCGPGWRMFDSDLLNSCKQYISVNHHVLPGGATPGSGDVWGVGGYISVQLQ